MSETVNAGAAPTPEQPIEYFAKRRKIYPRAIFGFFRRLKWGVMALCLALYYFAPFIRWDRGPHAPDQAILIDMVGRRAYFFFIEIWPQEVYYFTAVLILAAYMMFFATSLFGRVWCGYFCFQTVWTDLFIWVEKVVQGDRAARMRLDDEPWSLRKFAKKLITHLAWIGIGLLTGGAFVLYFNDAPTLVHQLLTGTLSPTVTIFILGLTCSTYVMAGLAREQVCTFMCPYARFQSAMFDEDSLIIAYDKVRGEPRGKHKKGESWDGKGHCIDCTQCVQVCPTGIDIRDGLQVQCIACGLCVDACNSVMEKMELPLGLIRYDTERNMSVEKKGQVYSHAPKLRLLRPRTILYTLVLCILLGVVGASLAMRSMLELHVLHDRNPLFVSLSDGSVRNGYQINILNKALENHDYRLSVTGIEGARLDIRSVGDQSNELLHAPANNSSEYRVFVIAPPQKEEHQEIEFVLTPEDGSAPVTHKSIFMGPEEE